MNTFQMVEGVNDPLDVQLLNDDRSGAGPQPFDATGMTIALSLTPADGSIAPSTAGKVTWLNASQSTVRYQPGVNDLKFSASPYQARWIVTDISGNTFAYPRFVPPDFINVGKD